MDIDYDIQYGESREDYIERVSEEMRQYALYMADYAALSQDFEFLAGEEYDQRNNSFWSHPTYNQ